jgi:hypothetical protein
LSQQHEKVDYEQQSIFERSVCEDVVLHEIVEQQKRADSRKHRHHFEHSSSPSSPPILPRDLTPTSHLGFGLSSLQIYERDTTECTALTDELTGDSDDNTISERSYIGGEQFILLKIFVFI